MKYLKYFEEAHLENKIDLVIDSFENLDLDHNIELDYEMVPDFLYRRESGLKVKTIPSKKYNVYIKFGSKPSSKFGKDLENVVKSCQDYSGLTFTMATVGYYGVREISKLGDFYINPTIEGKFEELKITFIDFTSLNENNLYQFDPEIIRDYFNDFELDNDISLLIESEDDEFGKFCRVNIDIPKLKLLVFNQFRDSLMRMLDNDENITFESWSLDLVKPPFPRLRNQIQPEGPSPDGLISDLETVAKIGDPHGGIQVHIELCLNVNLD